ncbi:MAG: hypothetical protein WAJ93_14030, partial [Candidatus Nitrosopolaris sp.]
MGPARMYNSSPSSLCDTAMYLPYRKIDPLPVRGCQKAAAIVLLSVLIYQIMVYYNCITGNKQPKAI